MDYLQKRLIERKNQNNLRELSLNKQGIDLFSNDYLGVIHHSVLQIDSVEYRFGSTGARLFSGNSHLANSLESYLSDFHQTEAALLFNSGYMANLGLLSSLGHRHTTFLYDEASHASIIDGLRLSLTKKFFRFKHNDLQDLEEKLKKHHLKGPVFVVVESLYSMLGTQAPLTLLARICAQYKARLIVDESHATGVFGKKGQGLVQSLGLQNAIFARVHTFGKALGCVGAVVVGCQYLKTYLMNFARSFIYTTALPDVLLNAVFHSYDWIEQNQTKRAHLQERIRYFCNKMSTLAGFKPTACSPIQMLFLGDNQKARHFAKHLRAKNIQTAAVLPPYDLLGKPAYAFVYMCLTPRKR